jgi:hypothetical protein
MQRAFPLPILTPTAIYFVTCLCFNGGLVSLGADERAMATTPTRAHLFLPFRRSAAHWRIKLASPGSVSLLICPVATTFFIFVR